MTTEPSAAPVAPPAPTDAAAERMGHWLAENGYHLGYGWSRADYTTFARRALAAAGGTDGEAAHEVCAFCGDPDCDGKGQYRAAGAGAPDDEALDYLLTQRIRFAEGRGHDADVALLTAALAALAAVRAELAETTTFRDNCERQYQQKVAEVAAEMNRTDAANAVIAAVRALHVEVEGTIGGYCDEDGFNWPCPTASALGSTTGTGSSDE